MAHSYIRSPSLFYGPIDDGLEENNSKNVTSSDDQYSWIFNTSYPPDDNVSALQFEKTSGQNNVICPACRATFKTLSTYYTHKNRFREGGICCVCRKKFRNQHLLVQHAKEFSHKNKCCYCGKVKPVNIFPKHIKSCKIRIEYRKRKTEPKGTNEGLAQMSKTKMKKRKRKHISK